MTTPQMGQDVAGHVPRTGGGDVKRGDGMGKRKFWMKRGDGMSEEKLWVLIDMEKDLFRAQGICSALFWSMVEPKQEPIPAHPALPALAAWLHEYGKDVIYGESMPGDWLDWYEDALDDPAVNQQERESQLADRHTVLPALRALVAALTPPEEVTT